MRPIIALLTDFGSQDHYVGAMKGAILSVCPEAQLVDVLHELPARDVRAGAFALAAAYPVFPAGTVFVVVVDPGVGSARRGLAIEAGSWRFVGPDNGLFCLVLADHPQARVHAITNASLFRDEVSATFHGRDVFGPVAAHLARGMPIEDVGPPAANLVTAALPTVIRRGETEWEGEIVQVDRFGNLVTNVTRRDVEGILAGFRGDPSEVVVVVEGFVLPLVRTYADVAEGEACAMIGSARWLEVAVNGGNASRLLGAARGASIRLRSASSERI